MNEKDLKILEQYEEQMEKFSRGRGSFLCEDKDRLYLLKEYGASENRAQVLQHILLYIDHHSDVKVDCFVKNKEGAIISKDKDGCNFILKTWYRGRECDVKCEEEILAAVATLAKLHACLQNIEEVSLCHPVLSCQEEFQKRMRELKAIRNYLIKKKGKTQFELKYLNCYEQFFKEAQCAIEGADSLKKQKLYLCHGDFTQHNVIISAENVCIVNFDKCHYGSQMEDLYLFMRKILEKYNWDLELGKKIYEAYHSNKKITDLEKQELYLRFLFPEKFWKISNYYYNSRKVWGVERNQKKLDKILLQRSEKQQFLSMLRE